MSLALIVGLSGGGLALAALAVWRQPALAFTQRAAAFLQEVRAEVRKVSWPTWEDLRKSTVVITILIIVIGIIIGLMDWFFSWLLIGFLGRVFG